MVEVVVLDAIVVVAVVDAVVRAAALVVMLLAATVEPPLEATTVISAQFQNCSPQPKCPLGPAGPEQDPDPTVHQAALEPTQ